MIRLLLILLFLKNVNTFIFDPFHFFTKSNVVCLPLQTLQETHDDKIDIIHENVFRNLPSKINIWMFKSITEKLPELHQSGDKLLETNDHLIRKILSSNIDINYKKVLIMNIIDFTLWGDHTASDMLRAYRNLIDHIL